MVVDPPLLEGVVAPWSEMGVVLDPQNEVVVGLCDAGAIVAPLDDVGVVDVLQASVAVDKSSQQL